MQTHGLDVLIFGDCVIDAVSAGAPAGDVKCLAALCSAGEGDGLTAAFVAGPVGQVMVGKDDLGSRGSVEDRLSVQLAARQRDVHRGPIRRPARRRTFAAAAPREETRSRARPTARHGAS